MVGGEVVIRGVRSTVTRAQLQLYHLDATETDWNLDVCLTGPLPRLRLSGIVKAPPLPGPSNLEVQFVDAPDVVVVDGNQGSLTPHDEGTIARLSRNAAGDARIEGRLRLCWTAFDSAAPHPNHEAIIELSVDAEIVVEQS